MKNLLLALALVLFASSTCFAQEPVTGEENPMPVVVLPDPPDIRLGTEYQIWLNKGDKSPYEGILLNPEAVTYILSEYLAQAARADASLQKQRSLDFALYKLNVSKLEVELETTREKSDLRLESKDSEIKRLRKINQDMADSQSGFWRDVLLVGSGTVVGTAIGIIVGVLLL